MGVWPIEGDPPRDCSKAGGAARILWIWDSMCVRLFPQPEAVGSPVYLCVCVLLLSPAGGKETCSVCGCRCMHPCCPLLSLGCRGRDAYFPSAPSWKEGHLFFESGWVRGEKCKLLCEAWRQLSSGLGLAWQGLPELRTPQKYQSSEDAGPGPGSFACVLQTGQEHCRRRAAGHNCGALTELWWGVNLDRRGSGRMGTVSAVCSGQGSNDSSLL